MKCMLQYSWHPATPTAPNYFTIYKLVWVRVPQYIHMFKKGKSIHIHLEHLLHEKSYLQMSSIFIYRIYSPHSFDIGCLVTGEEEIDGEEAEGREGEMKDSPLTIPTSVFHHKNLYILPPYPPHPANDPHLTFSSPAPQASHFPSIHVAHPVPS